MAPEVPDLHDDVVALRRPTEGDLDDIVTACQDPEIPRFTRVPSPYDRANAETFLANNADAWSDESAGRELSFVITDQANDRVLGAIGLRRSPDRGAAEVGYWLAADARGHGYVSRAVRLLTGWAFELGFERVELFTDPTNEPSQAVAVRCGFTREGVLRSYFEHPRSGRTDVVMFSLLPSDPA